MTRDCAPDAPCFWIRLPFEGQPELYAEPERRTSDDLARYAIWLSHDPRLAELLRRALDLVGDDG